MMMGGIEYGLVPAERRPLSNGEQGAGRREARTPSRATKVPPLGEINVRLGRRGLHEIPAAIFLKKKLKTLDLNNNSITKLPASIAALSRLTRLDLSFNQLKDIPEQISKLQNLREVNLRSNLLRSIPKGVIFLPRLRVLDVEDNPLSATHAEDCREANSGSPPGNVIVQTAELLAILRSRIIDDKEKQSFEKTFANCERVDAASKLKAVREECRLASLGRCIAEAKLKGCSAEQIECAQRVLDCLMSMKSCVKKNDFEGLEHSFAVFQKHVLKGDIKNHIMSTSEELADIHSMLKKSKSEKNFRKWKSIKKIQSQNEKERTATEKNPYTRPLHELNREFHGLDRDADVPHVSEASTSSSLVVSNNLKHKKSFEQWLKEKKLEKEGKQDELQSMKSEANLQRKLAAIKREKTCLAMLRKEEEWSDIHFKVEESKANIHGGV